MICLRGLIAAKCEGVAGGMCGIAGDIRFNDRPDESAMARMLEQVAHRGPNGGRQWTDGAARLGHRRLSVIDLNDRASQPMFSPDERWVLVFNGEIYNFRELRAELQLLGERFVTTGDSEILLRVLARDGVAGIARLNGMFAFAAWDRREQRLIAARDRFGEKPFYFWERPGNGGLVFASELRALAAHGDVPRQIDVSALSTYLANNYVVGRQAILRDVVRLGPAHWLTYSAAEGLRQGRYWDLASHAEAAPVAVKEDEALAELRSLIDDAVRMRLVADVPVGAFLSGGVDSSIVASSMQREIGGLTRTFSVGFDQADYDEVDAARTVARHLGIEFAAGEVASTLTDDIGKIAQAGDEPFADTSIVPTYYLSRFARESVTVALSGDGADELFGGYETYVASKLRSRIGALGQILSPPLTWVADNLIPVTHGKVSLDYKARRFARGLALEPDHAHWYWRNINDRGERDDLVREEFRGAMSADGSDIVNQFLKLAAHADSLGRQSYVDVNTWLVDGILHKVDRASMAHGLETRAPFLDHRVAEFAMRLPERLKLGGRQKKLVLRKAFASRFPPGWLDRKKRGFNAPVSHWMLGPLREMAHDLFASADFKAIFNGAAVDSLFREHELRRADHGLRLFGLLMFALWRQNLPAHTSI